MFNQCYSQAVVMLSKGRLIIKGNVLVTRRELPKCVYFVVIVFNVGIMRAFAAVVQEKCYRKCDVDHC